MLCDVAVTWDVFVTYVIPALVVFGGSLVLSYFVSGMSQQCDKMYLDQLARLRIQCDMMQHKHPVSKPVISRTDDAASITTASGPAPQVSKPVISRTDDAASITTASGPAPQVSKPVISRTDDAADQSGPTSQVSKPVISRTDDITLAILKIASEEPQTVRAIRSVLGQSREHISRTVKKMSEQGLLNRIEGRPYKYIITSAGQERLNREDAS